MAHTEGSSFSTLTPQTAAVYSMRAAAGLGCNNGIPHSTKLNCHSLMHKKATDASRPHAHWGAVEYLLQTLSD